VRRPAAAIVLARGGDNDRVSTKKGRAGGKSGPAGAMTADGSDAAAGAAGASVTGGAADPPRSERRAHMVVLAGELFAEKGYRATTVREIADAAGILSGSLYHHFDSKESIGDEILSRFINEVLADYQKAAATGGDPRAVLEQIVRSTSTTLTRHRAALAMLQNDWSYFAVQPRFGYLRKALREFERIWVTQLERGIQAGVFRADLDPKLTYRLLRDVLWLPSQWGHSGGYRTGQVVDGFLRLLFDGITSPGAK
jgi:AcrR family transcriptional regulator